MRKGEVGDVAGADDVIDAEAVEIDDQVFERVGVIVARPARQQVHHADPALVRELNELRSFVGQEVEIGEVRDAHGSWIRRERGNVKA
jgi:hypothetical protein